MKKNKFYFFAVLLGFCLLLTTCRKYDEGGFVRRTCKNLFGGNKVGDHKTWKLKLYEVNGIDSTYLIPSANAIPNFYDEFITFTMTENEKGSTGYSAICYLFEHYGQLGLAYPEMTLGKFPIDFTHNDSLQCKSKDNVLYCSRDIIFPELRSAILWQISRLTKNEIIIKTELKNSYKIILGQ